MALDSIGSLRQPRKGFSEYSAGDGYLLRIRRAGRG